MHSWIDKRNDEGGRGVTEVYGHKASLRAYFDGNGFERWAAIYGEVALPSRIRRSIREGHAQMLAQAGAWLDEHTPPTGARALDAGCGTGLFTVMLAQRGYDVTAIDIAPRMVSESAQTAQDAGVRERVTFQTGDLETVGGVYDVVGCFDVLVHYPAPAFAEMATKLASLSRGPLLLTYARWTRPLAALHWIGGRFPKGERRTEIQMIPDDFVTRTLANAGMRVHRRTPIDHGFYHVTLLEARPASGSAEGTQ